MDRMGPKYRLFCRFPGIPVAGRRPFFHDYEHKPGETMSRLLVVMALLGMVAPLFLSQARHKKSFGSERLVSVEPLPPLETGAMCPPEGEPESLMVSAGTPPALAGMRQPAQYAPASNDAAKAAVAARKPI